MKGKDLKNFLNSVFPFQYRIGMLPDNPDDCSAIMIEPGRPNKEVCGLREDAFQIVVRGSDYGVAEDAISGMYDAIHGLLSVQIGDRTADWILAVQTPFPIGYDDKDRALFSCNFRMHTKPSN